MTSVYQALTDARVNTAGQLWLPSLSLDMMKNDLALFCVPFDINIPTTTTPGLSTSWVTAATLNLHLSSTWQGDATIGNLSVRLYVKLEARAYNGSLLDEGKVRLNSGTAVDIGGPSFAWYTPTLDIGFSTGWQTVNVQVRGPSTGTADVQVQRAVNSDFSCYLEVFK